MAYKSHLKYLQRKEKAQQLRITIWFNKERDIKDGLTFRGGLIAASDVRVQLVGLLLVVL